MHVKVNGRAKGNRARLAGRDDDEAANPLEQARGTGGATADIFAGRGRIGAFAFHEQDGSPERGFSFPEAQQGV